MPSRQSKLWSRNRSTAATEGALAALLSMVVLAGCATTASAPAPTQRAPADERRFVLPPLTGYPLTVPLGTERDLATAAAGLAEASTWSAVEEQANRMLEADPGLHPAFLLLAQVAFLERDYAAVIDLLRPIVQELPDYDAAQLTLARAAEKIGDLPSAYAAYRASSEQLALSSARAARLWERSVEIVYNRIGESLGRGRLEDAARDLALLEEWAPGEKMTLRAARGVAVAGGDLESELSVVAALSALDPDDRSLEVRRAELELEVGEPSAGLRIFQKLSARYPEDLELAEKLAEARFVWRLEMLPKEAKDLVQLTELTRGDFASVLYWLFPEVRYSRSTTGLIVNDIFEHPAREQIVRVVNSELMSVDQAMHQFEPNRTMTRVEALTSFLALLSRSRSAPACLGSYDAEIGASVAGLCAAASRCDLIEEAAECLPGGPLSGPAAAQMSRKTLEQLGVG